MPSYQMHLCRSVVAAGSLYSQEWRRRFRLSGLAALAATRQLAKHLRRLHPADQPHREYKIADPHSGIAAFLLATSEEQNSIEHRGLLAEQGQEQSEERRVGKE